MKFGVIDIGTNTILLLLAEVDSSGQTKIFHQEARIARLGEKLEQNGRFIPDALNRARQVLKDYTQLSQLYKCDHLAAVGTAACRRSENTEVLQNWAQDNLGLSIQVISGDREAELIQNAIEHEFSHLSKPWVTLDIGGGSTELIFNDGTNQVARSFDFGVVKLTEAYLHNDPPQPDEKQKLKQHVETLVRPWVAQLPQTQPQNVIATAGTPTTLYALFQGLDEYDPHLVHKQCMSAHQLDFVLGTLDTVTIAERERRACLGPGRSDVILAGSYILQTLLQCLGMSQFHISDRGLRFGLLWELIDKKSSENNITI